MAGMAVWFPGVDYKMAAWVHFPNITLGGGHCLTLGTCDVKVEKSGCTGKRAQKVVFVAGKDSQMWKTNVMFGALQVLTCILCLASTQSLVICDFQLSKLPLRGQTMLVQRHLPEVYSHLILSNVLCCAG